MSDQQAPLEDKPELVADNPEEGTGTTEQQTQAEIDWQRQYQNLQPEYTRTAQELAERRQRDEDPEYQAEIARQWLEANGYQLPAQVDEEFVDPTDELRQQVQEINTRLQQQEEERTEQAYHASYREIVDPELAGMGVPKEFVEDIAELAYSQTPRGQAADLQGAVEQWRGLQARFAALPEVQQQAVEAWRKGKKAPHMSPTGREGTEVPDLSTHDGKVGWIMSRLHEGQQ